MNNAPPPNADPAERAAPRWTQGAIGVGLALVVGPAVALFFGLGWMEDHAGTALPVMALLGIMVLFGTLSLTSTLFRRLGLATASEPLALPPGSVRATIALALIVLFAIIAVSLLHPPRGDVRNLSGVGSDALTKLLADTRVEVIDSRLEPSGDCEQAATIAVPNWSACPERYAVRLVSKPSDATTEFAKTLLGLIGSLMTTAVSFYFASRASEVAREAAKTETQTGTDTRETDAGRSGGDGHATPHDEQADGCDLPIVDPTPDEALPPARGGVAGDVR